MLSMLVTAAFDFYYITSNCALHFGTVIDYEDQQECKHSMYLLKISACSINDFCLQSRMRVSKILSFLPVVQRTIPTLGFIFETINLVPTFIYHLYKFIFIYLLIMGCFI